MVFQIYRIFDFNQELPTVMRNNFAIHLESSLQNPQVISIDSLVKVAFMLSNPGKLRITRNNSKIILE